MESSYTREQRIQTGIILVIWIIVIVMSEYMPMTVIAVLLLRIVIILNGWRRKWEKLTK